MAKRKWFIDWSDNFFPVIRPFELANQWEDPKTYVECKRELIENARDKRDFWRDRLAEYQQLREPKER